MTARPATAAARSKEQAAPRKYLLHTHRADVLRSLLTNKGISESWW